MWGCSSIRCPAAAGRKLRDEQLGLVNAFLIHFPYGSNAARHRQYHDESPDFWR
jgi:hypothetical protein